MIGFIWQDLETLILETFEAGPCSKLDRNYQFRILTNLVTFLLRSSSYIAKNPERILIRRLEPDFDSNLIKSWQILSIQNFLRWLQRHPCATKNVTERKIFNNLQKSSLRHIFFDVRTIFCSFLEMWAFLLKSGE